MGPVEFLHGRYARLSLLGLHIGGRQSTLLQIFSSRGITETARSTAGSAVNVVKVTT